MTYSPNLRSAHGVPMRTNNEWQSSIIRLRQRLQIESNKIQERDYSIGAMKLPWFYLTTATDEESFNDLGEWFYTQAITQMGYFDDKKLKTKKGINYQLNPYWGGLVFSEVFRMRVVLFTRSASWDSTKEKDNLSYTWSTTTMDWSESPDMRISQKTGIDRMSDEEFNSRPTVELVYTTGHVGVGENDANHVQYLRRVYFMSEDSTSDEPTGVSPQAIDQTTAQNTDKHQRETEDKQTEVSLCINTTAAETKDQGGTVHGCSKTGVLTDDGDSSVITKRRKRVLHDTRPEEARRNGRITLTRKEKRTIKYHMQRFFDAMIDDNTAINGIVCQMMYNQVSKTYSTRMKLANGTYSKGVVCLNINDYDDNLILASEEFPNEWIGPSRDSNIELPESTVRREDHIEKHNSQNGPVVMGVGTSAGESHEDVEENPMETAGGDEMEEFSRVQVVVQGGRVLVDTRPMDARRNGRKSLSIKGRKRLLNRMSRFFNGQLQARKFKDDISCQLMYKPSEERFYVRQRDADGRVGPNSPCENIDEYDDNLVLSAKEMPNQWIGPTVGDCISDDPPAHVCTIYPIAYRQFEKRYCITHSLASALLYCGLRDSAVILAQQGDIFSTKQFADAIKTLKCFMQQIAPVIGQRTNTSSRKKKILTWPELLMNHTPYPTLVIPVLPNGSITHAFCVVDDLIFEASAAYALKLTEESIRWINCGSDSNIYCVEMSRFCCSCSYCRGLQIPSNP